MTKTKTLWKTKKCSESWSPGTVFWPSAPFVSGMIIKVGKEKNWILVLKVCLFEHPNLIRQIMNSVNINGFLNLYLVIEHSYKLKHGYNIILISPKLFVVVPFSAFYRSFQNHVFVWSLPQHHQHQQWQQ